MRRVKEYVSSSPLGVRPYMKYYESKDKPLKHFSVEGHQFRESDGTLFCAQDIFSRCIGFTYVTEDENYEKFMLETLGFDKINELSQHKSVYVGDKHYIRSQMKEDISFIHVNKNGKIGKILFYFSESSAEDIFLAFRRVSRTMSIRNMEPPLKLGEKLMREFCSGFFYMNEIEDSHHRRALNSYDGGRQETFVLGHWTSAYSYDVNSAYLQEMQSLPNVRPGLVDWIEDKEYRSEALMGFLDCDIDLPPGKVGLIAFRTIRKNGEERLFFPVNMKTSQTITKTEYDFLLKQGVRVSIRGASWAIPKEVIYPAFDAYTKTLLRLINDPATHSLGKSLSSRSWGKMASSGSSVYNPFYASELTSRVRCRLTEIALRNEDSVLGIKVDTIVTSKPIREKIGKKVGEMRLVSQGEAIICADNYVRFSPHLDKTWDMEEKGIYLQERFISLGDVLCRPTQENYLTGDLLSMMLGEEKRIGLRMNYEDGTAVHSLLSQYGSGKRFYDTTITKERLEREQLTTQAPSSLEDMKLILKNWHGINEHE